MTNTICIKCLHYPVCPNSKDGIISGCPFFSDYSKWVYLLSSDRSKWIQLLCKVGDKVYEVDRTGIYGNTIKEHIVRQIEIYDTYTLYRTESIVFSIREIGKTIFLTPEEAEKALGEREKND